MMCTSHIPYLLSSQSRVTRTFKSLRVIALQVRINVESNEIWHFFHAFSSLQNGAQRNKNGAQCCFCSFATTLFWSKFLVRAVFNWFLSFIAKQFHKSRLTLMQWLYRFAFHIQPKNYQTWKLTSVWTNRAAFLYFDDLDLIISA